MNVRTGFLAMSIALLCGGILAEGSPTTQPGLAISLVVTANPAQPAGLPVIVEISLTNIGSQTLSVAQCGPGNYVPGRYFSASVRDATGQWRRVPVFNGQYEACKALGPTITIKPGEVSKIPIALAPLPAGDFLIKFESSQSVRTYSGGRKEVVWPAAAAEPITVRILDDPREAEKWGEEWVGKIARGEPFASRVAEQFPMAQVTAALVAGLNSDEKVTLAHFAEVLSKVPKGELPQKTDVAVAAAMHKAVSEPNFNVGINLATIASNIGSDTAMGAVLEMAHANTGSNGEYRWHAINCLAAFKQPAATAALEAFVKEEDEWVRFAAARGLAGRHNVIAIPVLIDEIQKNRPFRQYAVQELAHFPNDPRVLPVIRAATMDADQSVAENAREAIKNIGAR